MPADGQLLRFRVSNHRSLRDEQELSFIASSFDKDDPRLLHPQGLDEAVLPVCAVYGANGSGKSNLIHAFGFMQRAVMLSQRRWEPTEGVPRDPFALSDRKADQSTFVVDFILESTRYEYGFAVDDEVVKEEWLHAWPGRRKQEWFNRDDQSFEFGRMLHGENKAIGALTRTNSLFLSAAAQNNHSQLTPVFEWLGSRRFNGPSPIHVRNTSWWKQFSDGEMNPQSELVHKQVCALLRAADLGIEGFRVEEPSEVLEIDERPVSISNQRLMFSHRSGERSMWLSFDEESTGTKTLIRLIPVLLQIIERGGMLIIDELSSLHPMLCLALIRLFQEPKSNPKGAQFLFNTHDASLLGNLLTDPPPLRRDQIWLTEKDQEGATRLYPLTDFAPRAAENLERGYLQGRYGAVPFLGSLFWDLEEK